MKENDICPHCKEGKLVYCPEVFPWSGEKLICPNCFGTYIFDDE